jgi:hypothetical protein
VRLHQHQQSLHPPVCLQLCCLQLLPPASPLHLLLLLALLVCHQTLPVQPLLLLL